MPQPMPGEGQRSQTKFIVFENFEKMNTQSVRQALKENELAWIENIQPIAPNNLRTVPAPASAALATITGTVSEIFYADLGGIDYLVVFTQAGSGYLITISTGAVSHFAPDGTFSPYPDVTVWQASRLLIADPVAGYSTFDGTVFVKQGGVSPNIVVTNGGSLYATPPTVTISGGSGTGATAHAVLTNGVVTSIVLDNPGTGYKAGDVLTVTITGTAGSGAAGHVTMTGFGVGSITCTNVFFNSPGPAPGTYPLTITGGGGVGATATVNVVAGNKVDPNSIVITNPGSGYTSAPSVTPGGGFTSPTFVAFLGTEQVATIVRDAGGAGYGVAPTVTIVGGGASVPATAHSTVSAGTVTSLILDTPGSGYTSTPSVAIGSGASAATATAHVWPFISSSIAANAYTTVAVFQGRVWLGGGQLLTWSGTGASYANVAYDDFLAADASGSLLLSDADLIHAITALRSFNNYLWIMGDQSIKQIGNVSLNGAGNVTLFTILTLSSDQGTIYKKSCISYNRVFMFANNNGIYGVFGSSVQKLSGDLDGIWKNVDFSQPPQGALADISAIHNAAFLVRYNDPLLAATRSIIVCFDGKKWFVVSQGDSLNSIVTSASLSTGLNSLYGSSGSDVTQLVARDDLAVSFTVRSALTHHGNAVQGKKTIRAGFAYSFDHSVDNATMTLDTDPGFGGQSIVVPLAIGFNVPHRSIEGSGTYLGMTLSGSSKGLTLTNMIVEYQETPLWRSNA